MEHTPEDGFRPRILVFSTHNISDPGIDLAGSRTRTTRRPYR